MGSGRPFVNIPYMQANIFHSDRPFSLEGGGTLPGLQIAYHTYGIGVHIRLRMPHFYHGAGHIEHGLKQIRIFNVYL